MAEIFTIYIERRSVAGVLLFSNAKKSLVVRNYAFETVDVEEGDMASAVARLKEQIGYGGSNCVAVLSPQYFSFRKLRLPFSDRKKIAKILPFELEEQFSLDSSAMQVDFVINKMDNGESQVLAGLLSTEVLSELIAGLNSCGLDPEVVTLGFIADCFHLMEEYEDLSSFFILEIGNDYAAFFLIQDGIPVIMRSLPVPYLPAPEQGQRKITEDLQQALEGIWRQVERTFIVDGWGNQLRENFPGFLFGSVGMNYQVLDFLKRHCYAEFHIFDLSAKPFLKIHSGVESKIWKSELMNKPLSIALYQTTQNSAHTFNFRKGLFRKRVSGTLFNRYMNVGLVGLGIVIVCCLFYGGWEHRQLVDRKNVLKSEIEKTFREAMPQVSKVVNPVQQLRSAIAEVTENFEAGGQEGEGHRKLNILAEISARIPPSLPVTVAQFVADFETVRIKAQTNDFNNVDRIKKELTKSAMFKTVQISSANVASDDGSVRFDLKLELN